jgi:hypothetical protein
MRTLLFLILLIGSGAFGQSVEELNKQLRSQLSQAKTTSDSLKTVFTELKTPIIESWYQIEKNEFRVITEQGEWYRMLQENIVYLYEALDTLGDKPGKIYNIQELRHTRIPLMETERLYRSYSYLSKKKLKIFFEAVRDTLVLGKCELKLENDKIRNVLDQYAYVEGNNLKSIATLTQYEKDMQVFRVKAGEIYQQSQTAYDKLWNAYTGMKDRFSKLKAAYLTKGEKAFPPVYKEVFEWAAQYNYPKDIDPVPTKL